MSAFAGLMRQGADHARLERALARLAARFEAAGYARVSVPHLMAGEALLDLYGEDIRTRAFLFSGTSPGAELCLRPDFTLPVVAAHGAGGWARPARYAYAGPVFRRQPPGSRRPVEYLQAGIEDLGDEDRAGAEARVFALVHGALDDLGAGPLGVTTGDLGIVFALIEALEMPARRRHLLRRHFWRPARFHALVAEAVAGPAAPSPMRARLLEAARSANPEAAVAALAEEAGEAIGLRELDDILDRARDLARAAEEPPMPPADAELLEAVLAVRAPAPEALARLRDLAAAAGVAMADALDRFEARLEALARAGIDAAALPFDAAFGRTLEYYDGFVFEITAAGRADLPPLAGGGRYDAITARLGAPGPVPAVGAMIRPEAALAAAANGGGGRAGEGAP